MATEKRHIDNHLMLERLSKIHAKIKSGCYPNSQQLALLESGGNRNLESGRINQF